MSFIWTRVGPVYLYWSEWSNAAVIGPDKGAWGGDDVFRCDAHPQWQGEGREAADVHASEHGWYIGRGTEAGQGLAEYALILALIAIVAIVALLFLGGAISSLLGSVGQSI
jgi:Flp pilus assembly pilin Flp